jgi:hypothetical protein
MTPKTKIGVACAALVALGTAAGAGGFDAALLGRATLTCAALSGLGWWYLKARGAGAAGEEKPRLSVIARTGLSPRTGLALVEVDGRAILIVHGEGFAEIHPAGRKKQRRRGARRSFESALRSVS